MVVKFYNPSYMGGIDRNIAEQGMPQAKTQDPTWKITITEKELNLVQVVEHLPNKCEAQNSNPSTNKKKKERERERKRKRKRKRKKRKEREREGVKEGGKEGRS
jgi:hypothetical protein